MTYPCDDCKCRVVPDSRPVTATVSRPGLIALVVDAPTGAESLGRSMFQGAAGEILEATIRAVVRATGETPPLDLTEIVSVHHAVSRPTPGSKAPRIGDVRACHARLMDELARAQPSSVVSLGAAACASLAGAGKATPITKWRGMMRWLELPDGRTVPWVATISPGSVVGKNEYYRDLSSDLWKAWTQRAPLDPPDVDTVVPRTVGALRRSLEVLEGASVVACDVETAPASPREPGTSLVGHRGRLLSVAFGAIDGDLKGYSVVVPLELLESAEVQDLCWDRAYRTSSRTVYQNGKFDLKYLMRWWGEESVPRDALLGDTMLLASLLDERPAKDRIGGLGLKEQASFRYDYPDYHWDWSKFYSQMAHDGYFGWTCEDWDFGEGKTCPYPHPDPELRADIEGMYQYQAKDVYWTARWWFDLVAEAEAESPALLRAHDEVMIPASRTLAACELRGAPLDLRWLAEFTSRLRRRAERREVALHNAKFPPNLIEGFALEAVDLASPAQVGELMYDVWRMTPDMRKRKFKDGVAVEDRSTDKEHIEAAIQKYARHPQLSHAASWLRTLLRWRADVKNLSTYSETLAAKADREGRIHAEFKLHGTITGRLSAATPNLQNIPAVDKRDVGDDGRVTYTLRGARTTFWPARRAFAPRDPDSWWAEVDYSQLELRVAAWLSGDEKFRDVFVEGRDIHLEVASTMFSKPPEQISKPERYLAKAVDFGILYGRQGKAIAAGEEMDYAERELGMKRWDAETADAFIAKFLRGYPKLGLWLRENAASAVRQYYVETPFGRRRRFPFKPRTKWDLMRIERQANNTPIQSAASDLCIQAMARLEPLLPNGARLLFPVHDSICLEVRKDLIHEVEKVCREQMEIVLPGGVPLTVDFEYGPSWADVSAH